MVREKGRYNFIDMFTGCGGMTEGFLQSKSFNHIAAVEWKKSQVTTLQKRMEHYFGDDNDTQNVLHFDIQRTDELLHGWEESGKYSANPGLLQLIGDTKIDIVIGGPPCQAYSIAGRLRDEHGMRNDYRNFLFESYLKVINILKPKIVVFENVTGLLSAAPTGEPVLNLITQEFLKNGYIVPDDIKSDCVIDTSEFGVPQSRKRVIILGIRSDAFINPTQTLNHFYHQILPKYKTTERKTVEDAIGDLPKWTPKEEGQRSKKFGSHICSTENTYQFHKCRYHNNRDINIFNLLSEDIESGKNEFVDSKALTALYEREVGGKSTIHRYHVLRKNKPSTTIIAHLKKDGNRFIHYDPTQSRTLTPREAARLQSFPDNFHFQGSQGQVYEMIGNAVPPLFAEKLACSIRDLLNTDPITLIEQLENIQVGVKHAYKRRS